MERGGLWPVLRRAAENELGDSVRSSAGIVTIPGLAAWMEAGLCPPISMTPCSRLRTALIHLGISY